MSGAFAHLALCSGRNWLRHQARRLRRARYLAALLAGALYLWVIVFQQPEPREAGPRLEEVAALHLSTSVGLLLLAAWWWLVRADAGALAFSPAETQLLFPAPLRRSRLVLYKVARGQLAVLLNVVLLTALFWREGTPVPALQRAVGLWILFSTLFLHRLAAALTRLGAAQSRRALLVRLLPPAALVGAALAAVAVALLRALPEVLEARQPWELLAAVGAALRAPAADLALLPTRVMAAPLFPRDPGLWVRDAALAALFLAVHLVWVIRTDLAFEDAAVAASRRRAERLAAWRGERIELPRRAGTLRLPLAPGGAPEYAILWKNLSWLLKGARPLLLASLLAGLATLGMLVVADLPGGLTAGRIVLAAALLALGTSTAVGAFVLRNDLRSDLIRLDLLRTYPVPGDRMVLMEVLSVALPLALVQWVALLAALLASLGEPAIPLALSTRLVLVAAAGLLFPAVALLAVLIQNAGALLLPDWVRLGSEPGGGVQVIGQNMILLGGSWLLLAALLLAPVLVGGAVGLAAAAAGPGAVLVAAAATVSLIGLEAHLLVRWLGRVFERTDPSAVLGPGQG